MTGITRVKRLERSFAYRGFLAAVVGAVVCIPGAIVQWWPALVRLENSRNVRPMIAKVSLGAGFLLIVAGLAWVGWCAAKWALCRRAKAGGQSVQARVLCVEPDYSRPVKGAPAYVVRCMYTDENGRKTLYRSLPLQRDPGEKLGETVTVWRTPGQPRCYYVDVADSLAKTGKKE